MSRAVARAWPLLTVAAPVVCAIWAFAPLEPIPIQVPELPSSPAQEVGPHRPLELAAFAAPLWIAPPAPPPPPPPPRQEPPPPPLKLQLLAIVREAEVLKAVLYDPETDRLLVVTDGQRLGESSIERVRSNGVEIRDRSGVRTLTLADAAGSAR